MDLTSVTDLTSAEDSIVVNKNSTNDHTLSIIIQKNYYDILDFFSLERGEYNDVDNIYWKKTAYQNNLLFSHYKCSKFGCSIVNHIIDNMIEIKGNKKIITDFDKNITTDLSGVHISFYQPMSISGDLITSDRGKLDYGKPDSDYYHNNYNNYNCNYNEIIQNQILDDIFGYSVSIPISSKLNKLELRQKNEDIFCEKYDLDETNRHRLSLIYLLDLFMKMKGYEEIRVKYYNTNEYSKYLDCISKNADYMENDGILRSLISNKKIPVINNKSIIIIDNMNIFEADNIIRSFFMVKCKKMDKNKKIRTYLLSSNLNPFVNKCYDKSNKNDNLARNTQYMKNLIIESNIPLRFYVFIGNKFVLLGEGNKIYFDAISTTVVKRIYISTDSTKSYDIFSKLFESNRKPYIKTNYDFLVDLTCLCDDTYSEVAKFHRRKLDPNKRVHISNYSVGYDILTDLKKYTKSLIYALNKEDEYSKKIILQVVDHYKKIDDYIDLVGFSTEDVLYMFHDINNYEDLPISALVGFPYPDLEVMNCYDSDFDDLCDPCDSSKSSDNSVDVPDNELGDEQGNNFGDEQGNDLDIDNDNDLNHSESISDDIFDEDSCQSCSSIYSDDISNFDTRTGEHDFIEDLYLDNFDNSDNLEEIDMDMDININIDIPDEEYISIRTR